MPNKKGNQEVGIMSYPRDFVPCFRIHYQMGWLGLLVCGQKLDSGSKAVSYVQLLCPWNQVLLVQCEENWCLSFPNLTLGYLHYKFHIKPSNPVSWTEDYKNSEEGRALKDEKRYLRDHVDQSTAPSICIGSDWIKTWTITVLTELLFFFKLLSSWLNTSFLYMLWFLKMAGKALTSKHVGRNA